MRLLIAFILVFNNIAASTQEMGFNIYSKPDPDQDSNFLRTYGNYFVPALYTIKHFSNFTINDKLNKTSLEYQPNIALGVGLCASYKWMGIAGSTAFGFLNRDDLKYGKTKKLDLYTNLYSKKFLYDINYQQYQGYYLKNVSEIDSTWKYGDAHPQRSDIRTITAGFALYYIMNYTRFSLKAPYNYCDEQLRSAGSFILGGYVSGYAMWTDMGEPIVPTYIVPFQDSARYTSIGSLDFGSSGGYAYTKVFKKHWFVSAMLLPGLSVQVSQVNNIYGQMPGKINPAAKLQARFAIGYSRPRFYWGWVSVADAFFVKGSQSFEYTYSSGYTCMSIGTRILPPKRRKLSVVK